MVEEAGKEGMDSGGGGRAGETRGFAIYYRFCYPTFIYSFIPYYQFVHYWLTKSITHL